MSPGCSDPGGPVATATVHAPDRHRSITHHHYPHGDEVRDVARALGIKYETLWNWVANACRDRDAGPAALSSDERLELARLLRKVAEPEVEKEVLKKAAVVNA